MGHRELYREISYDADGRVARQAMRRSLLDGDMLPYLRSEIRIRHRDALQADAIERCASCGYNLFQHAVDRVAVVYQRPPRRTWSDPAESALWDTLKSPLYDAVMQQAERMAIGIGCVLIQPYIIDGQVHLSIIPPDSAAVVWRDESSISEMVYIVDDERYVHWDASAWAIYDRRTGKPMGGRSHTMGRVPAVVMRSHYPGTRDKWGSMALQSVVDATIEVAIKRSYRDHVQQLQSHLQLYREKTESVFGSTAALESDEVHTGPAEVLEGRYGVLSLQADISAHTAAIETDIRRAASAMGISEEMLTAKNYRSGLHAAQAAQQLSDLRVRNLVWFRPADEELMRVSSEYAHAVAGEPLLTSTPKVEFTDPSEVAEDATRMDLFERGVVWGLDSPVDYILRTDPTVVDRDAAMELIRRRAGEIAVVRGLIGRSPDGASDVGNGNSSAGGSDGSDGSADDGGSAQEGGSQGSDFGGDAAQE